ncbi:MAG TPA: hypothetical protein VK143_02255 [Burkholderiales bacterium]|nr:hypothetical protein [Burkholderiales bacterium]
MLAIMSNFANLGRPIGLIEHVATSVRWRGHGIGSGMHAPCTRACMGPRMLQGHAVIRCSAGRGTQTLRVCWVRWR